MDQKYLTDSESLSLNIEATCLLLSSPRNFQYEIKTDKYNPYPSMISMFTSDSQHPPKSRHAVHLGDFCMLSICQFVCSTCCLCDKKLNHMSQHIWFSGLWQNYLSNSTCTCVKVFRIIPEFRILRLNFFGKSASKC